MMKIIFAALLLVGISAAYEVEYEVPSNFDELVKFVFGRPRNNDADNARVKRQTTSEWENSVCECVPYYQCNYNGTMNDDGEGIIDIRTGFVGTVDNPTSTRRPCDHYLSVCCLPPEIVPGHDQEPGNGGNQGGHDGGNNQGGNGGNQGGHDGGNNQGGNGGNQGGNGGNQGGNGGNQGGHDGGNNQGGNGGNEGGNNQGGNGGNQGGHDGGNNQGGNGGNEGGNNQGGNGGNQGGHDGGNNQGGNGGNNQGGNGGNNQGGNGGNQGGNEGGNNQGGNGGHDGGNNQGGINGKPHVNKGCGYRNPNGVGFRITGNFNNEANFAEFPWMVAVLKTENVQGNLVKVYKCGGSLIHRRVVLTAAHCVHGVASTELSVRAGEWDTQTVDEPLPHQDRGVSVVTTHPGYTKNILYNDYALLILTKPVDLADNVEVVCLPEANEYFDRTKCFATGWGKSEFGEKGYYQVILKAVELPTVPHDKCQNLLRKTRLGGYFKLHESFMCAGGVDNIDTCTGDGGSPLVCPLPQDPTRYTQAGIVAWGIGCGQKDVPGVYADVTKSRQWIDDTLASYNIDSISYSPGGNNNYPPVQPQVPNYPNYPNEQQGGHSNVGYGGYGR